jgi:hypothetical protein
VLSQHSPFLLSPQSSLPRPTLHPSPFPFSISPNCQQIKKSVSLSTHQQRLWFESNCLQLVWTKTCETDRVHDMHLEIFEVWKIETKRKKWIFCLIECSLLYFVIKKLEYLSPALTMLAKPPFSVNPFTFFLLFIFWVFLALHICDVLVCFLMI